MKDSLRVVSGARFWQEIESSFWRTASLAYRIRDSKIIKNRHISTVYQFNLRKLLTLKITKNFMKTVLLTTTPVALGKKLNMPEHIHLLGHEISTSLCMSYMDSTLATSKESSNRNSPATGTIDQE